MPDSRGYVSQAMNLTAYSPAFRSQSIQFVFEKPACNLQVIATLGGAVEPKK